MSDPYLRDHIAAIIDREVDGLWEPLDVADSVMELITARIPPIITSAIQGYAQSHLAALDYHGDGSAIEELRRLNNDATQIANYATTHQNWNGAK